MTGAAGKAGFETAGDQRAHFKTDWHRLNVKRRLAARAPLSEEEFEQLLDNPHEVRFSFQICTLLAENWIHVVICGIRSIKRPYLSAKNTPWLVRSDMHRLTRKPSSCVNDFKLTLVDCASSK